MTSSGWQFWIDRGGTFTDVIGRAPDNRLHTCKLLSDNPQQYADAAAEGIHRLLTAAGGSRHVSEIRMGTTVATNALLERAGAATGLLITRGFGDALRIGYQNRPNIFDLHIRMQEPLYRLCLEVEERIDASGAVLEAINEAPLAQTLAEWRDAGLDSVAICFLHSWINPAHERCAARIARASGFRQVSVSHEVSPLMKLVSRGGTTVANAYLSPVVAFYVATLQTALRSYRIDCQRILFMQSNGGLVSSGLFHGKDAVLSGPAGGVVGMAAAAERAGLNQLIGFDMGGTSTDVSVYAGRPELASDTEVAGVYLRTPMIRIHTIAAGGGSRLRFGDGRFQVGPDSAGADPGPRCYGRGGPLTVTDANLLLGRIQAEHFPATFGPESNKPVDREIVAAGFAQLAQEISQATNRAYNAAETARGFLRVAVENMAHALRKVTIQRGRNPADFTLCCFGGAGGQHACQVAERVGITRILIDPLAGVLSAWGMGAAVLSTYRQRALNRVLDAASLTEVDRLLPGLRAECGAELQAQGLASVAINHSTWLQLKAAGSDTVITLPLADLAALHTDFLAAHQAQFGYRPDSPQLVIESLRVQAEGSRQAVAAASQVIATARTAALPVGQADLWLADAPQAVLIYDRATLRPGQALKGPAIIAETTGTTVVDPGWALTVNDNSQLLLTRNVEPVQHAAVGLRRDPVMLEIFSNHFMHIADEMGVVLQNTARSVNIKERLDFSCALFTPAGDLIANAPHIPVHLGSMDDSVKALLCDHGDGLASGNVYLCNAPYNGGTHLPDLTVISPVTDTDGQLLFVVASRAHHADVGGISPGSMPPESRHIDEEGIVFDNFLLLDRSGFREAELRDALAGTAWPARNPDQNIADCKAQLAANERGRQLLISLVERYGLSTVQAYMQHTLDNAEESVRAVIADLAAASRLPADKFTYAFDNGQVISVSIAIDPDRREALIDFTGTSAAADNNLNAPISVCQAAVMYVFRTLVSSEIPLNAGCRRPLRLHIPAGCMLNPQYPAAVVGGNVETSQCITDALYGALGILAASQGTMNNLSFGNQQLQYYETICGGAGAGNGFAGADAVQTHMTNSRMTDAEVLETRYPVLVREFSIRRGSGGAGEYRGGDGVIRRLEFRAGMSAAILSNHRLVAPFGLNGGECGAPGQNSVIRRNGAMEQLGSVAEITVEKGDALVIATPGGGGFGVPRIMP